MKRFLAIASAFILLIVGVWYYVAHEVESQITRSIFNMNQRGHKASTTNLHVSGFPLNITLKMDSAQAQILNASGTTCTLAGKNIYVSSSIFAPLTPAYKAETVTVSHAKSTGEQIHFSAASIDGTIHIDLNKDMPQGDLRALDVRLANGASKGSSAREWKVEIRDLGRDKHTDQQTASFVSSLKNVTLPPEHPITEADISMVYLDALIKGPYFPTSRQSLENWSKQKGNLEVRTFSVKGGQLDAQATGELRLDDYLMPEGKLTIRTPTLDPVINLMSLYGTVSKGGATALKFIQGLGLSISDAKESKFTLQVIAKEGLLSVGGIPLAKLKPVLG